MTAVQLTDAILTLFRDANVSDDVMEQLNPIVAQIAEPTALIDKNLEGKSIFGSSIVASMIACNLLGNDRPVLPGAQDEMRELAPAAFMGAVHLTLTMAKATCAYNKAHGTHHLFIDMNREESLEFIKWAMSNGFNI